MLSPSTLLRTCLSMHAVGSFNGLLTLRGGGQLLAGIGVDRALDAGDL